MPDKNDFEHFVTISHTNEMDLCSIELSELVHTN